jgi:hypothetical protein
VMDASDHCIVYRSVIDGFWSLHCLSFCDRGLLITTLVSSNCLYVINRAVSWLCACIYRYVSLLFFTFFLCVVACSLIFSSLYLSKHWLRTTTKWKIASQTRTVWYYCWSFYDISAQLLRYINGLYRVRI